jgi:lipopolysaccharide transport system ATP-binding protein
MSSTIIQVENLGKKYLIKHQQQGSYTALRDVITDKVKSFGKKIISPWNHKQSSTYSTTEEFWALKDISFKVKQGEVVGIIGRNGAGKSTLLKILSRITEPTTGRIRIKGRVASLLEVGTGFHPELTGRQNIFLNGAILGMGKAEIKRKFDEIVTFAEVVKFLDTPVKRYSSGMYVRLAFAVAAHLESDVLLVDEVLAVGDAVFQRKCLSKIGDISGQGRTVLLVSHNMGSIVKLCDTVIWLGNGYVRMLDSAGKTVQTYLSSGLSGREGKIVFEEPDETKEAYIRSVEFRNNNDEITSEFDVLSPIQVNTAFCLKREFKNFRVSVEVSQYDGTPIFSTTSQDYDSIEGPFNSGSYHAQLLIPGQFLASGGYLLSIGIGEPPIKNYDSHLHFMRFRVQGCPFRLSRSHGFLVYPFKWRLIE